VAAVAPTIANLPTELTVKQRTTTDVPGSGGGVRLTIDDITGGQVMTSLADKEGAVIFAPTSLEPGESAAFTLGDQTYTLTLDALENELVGDDSATFVIADAPADEEAADAEAAKELATAAELENERIRQLIDHVAHLEGAVFIRNGEEHTPAEAAEHLRQKWEAGADEITTAEEFITKAASESSLTGEPYRLRTADGVERKAGEYLKERLREMAAKE
jgi:hypothetical protein